MERIYIIIILALLFSCANDKPVRYDDSYDIEILYNYYQNDSSKVNEYKNQEYLRDGNLYLIFEQSFHRDTVYIYLNDKLLYKDIVSTEPSSGVAKEYIFSDINSIENIDLRINKGKTARLEIDTMNIFTVALTKSKLQIRVPKNVPVYY